MNLEVKDAFLKRWGKFFPGADLPIVFQFTDDPASDTIVEPAKGWRCLICDLARVRNGHAASFAVESIGCGGGKRYTGFTDQLAPNFEYFLSCGIEGKLEGERYKKSPELVRELLKGTPTFKAPAQYIAFKRFDQLTESDQPAVVIFFATPDVLSGLFTLANFDTSGVDGVTAPFGAGCSTVVQTPLVEALADKPRAALGMFDVSARPCVPAGVLTFAAPWSKFERMVADMDESFLITASWNKVRDRLAKG